MDEPRERWTPKKNPPGGEIVGALVLGAVAGAAIPMVVAFFASWYTSYIQRGVSDDTVVVALLNVPLGALLGGVAGMVLALRGRGT
jgi:hypothetical protein